MSIPRLATTSRLATGALHHQTAVPHASLPVPARQLPQGASFFLHAALPARSAPIYTRSISTRSRPRSQAARRTGTTLLYAAAPFSLFSWLGLTSEKPPQSSTSEGERKESGLFSGPGPVDGDVPNRSSALKYPASGAALRQASSGPEQLTLVFLNINAPSANFSSGRGLAAKEWLAWIGYFREQGYDCLDVNAVDQSLPSGVSARAQQQREHELGKVEPTSVKSLAKELESQVQLQMFPRGAVLFTRGSYGASVAAEQISGSSPQFSALVLLLDKPGDEEAFQSAMARLPANFKTVQVLSQQQSAQDSGKKITIVHAQDVESEKAIRDVENWLFSNGF